MVYGYYFRLSENGRRNAFLATSMIANLVILGFFKYFNFFRDNMVGLGHMLGYEWAPPALEVALPVGISFYTFVTMSYGIDAYRGDIVPERSFLRMALFVSYFPHLVAGPIIRPEQIAPHAARALEAFAGAVAERLSPGGRRHGQESDHRRFDCAAGRGHSRPSRRPAQLAGLARDCVIRRADLLRLLRLYRRGPRRQPDAWGSSCR